MHLLSFKYNYVVCYVLWSPLPSMPQLIYVNCVTRFGVAITGKPALTIYCISHPALKANIYAISSDTHQFLTCHSTGIHSARTRSHCSNVSSVKRPLDAH